MSALRHILHFKLISALKSEQPVTLRLILRGLGVTAVYLAFAVGTFMFVKAGLHYTLTQTKIGLFLLHQFMAMLLFVFFIAVNIGNIIVAYSTLYKSEEVVFLMAKPIPPEKIFLIKFLDNFFYSSTNFLVILMAGILAYTHYFKINPLMTVIILLVDFLPFTFSAGMIGVLLLLIILRIATKIGLKPVIFVIGLFYSFSLIGFFRSMAPVRLANAVLEHYPNVNQYFSNLLPPSIRLLPNQWLASSLFWLVKNDASQAVRYIFYQVGLCLGLFGLTIALGYHLYYKTWLLVPTLRTTRVEKRVSSTIWMAKPSLLSPPTEAILKRDLLNFIREPSQIVHFAVMLILILIFISSVTHINLVGARTPQLQTLIFLTVFSFNAFLMAALALRFVFPLISLEGVTIWKLRSAPLAPSMILNLKLLPYLIVLLAVGESLNYFACSRFAPVLNMVSAIATALIGITLMALNFGMGGVYANFTEKSAIRLSSSQGATLGYLLSLIYLVITIAWLYLPTRSYFANGGDFLLFSKALIGIGLLSTIVSLYFYRLGSRSYNRASG